MAEENGTADVQEPQLDDFDRTLGGTPDEGPESVGTPAPGDTPAFDPETWNGETGDLALVPEAMRPAAAIFQRRSREMSSGVSDKIGEVNTYETELLNAQARIAELESAPSPTAMPGQNAAEVAHSLGVDNTNSTPQALQSLNTVVEVIDNHPLAKQVQALTSEIQALKWQTGASTEYVEGQQSTVYNNEYDAAVTAHGKENTDKAIENFGDMRGRTRLDGNPHTVDSLTALYTGKAAADGAAVDAQAAAARADALGTAGGIRATSGLTPDNRATPTDADIERLFNT